MTKEQLKTNVAQQIGNKTAENSVSPTNVASVLNNMVDNLATQAEVATITENTRKIVSTEVPSGVAVDGTEWIMYKQ